RAGWQQGGTHAQASQPAWNHSSKGHEEISRDGDANQSSEEREVAFHHCLLELSMCFATKFVLLPQERGGSSGRRPDLLVKGRPCFRPEQRTMRETYRAWLQRQPSTGRARRPAARAARDSCRESALRTNTPGRWKIT